MNIEIHQSELVTPFSEKRIKEAALFICSEIGITNGNCSVIFVDDVFLAKMHERYLNDPSVTDVITFNLSEDGLEGEIYISYERAREQAKQFQVGFEQEILRLVIHGFLHLAGYDDLSVTEYTLMKEKENALVETISSKYL